MPISFNLISEEKMVRRIRKKIGDLLIQDGLINMTLHQ